MEKHNIQEYHYSTDGGEAETEAIGEIEEGVDGFGGGKGNGFLAGDCWGGEKERGEKKKERGGEWIWVRMNEENGVCFLIFDFFF